jgi:hypothetical protein
MESSDHRSRIGKNEPDHPWPRLARAARGFAGKWVALDKFPSHVFQERVLAMRLPVLFLFSVFCVMRLSAALSADEKPEHKQKPGLEQKKSEDPAEQLKILEARIKKNPTDPMLYYRKAQTLMKLKKYDEGYKTAQTAMKRFMANNNNLAWMMLESIDLGNLRVDVHFNMGPKERRPPRIGIIDPLTFRVWTKDKDPKLLEMIDFEYGMMDGKPMTAALGQMQGQAHLNFGMVDAKAKYEEIRKKAIELIKKRHPKP